ncbi:hypothetical protein [Zarconia navalis]|nr:hypothetical protein [Zarconia navalis]
MGLPSKINFCLHLNLALILPETWQLTQLIPDFEGQSATRST